MAKEVNKSGISRSDEAKAWYESHLERNGFKVKSDETVEFTSKTLNSNNSPSAPVKTDDPKKDADASAKGKAKIDGQVSITTAELALVLHRANIAHAQDPGPATQANLERARNDFREHQEAILKANSEGEKGEK